MCRATFFPISLVQIYKVCVTNNYRDCYFKYHMGHMCARVGVGQGWDGGRGGAWVGKKAL